MFLIYWFFFIFIYFYLFNCISLCIYFSGYSCLTTLTLRKKIVMYIVKYNKRDSIKIDFNLCADILLIMVKSSRPRTSYNHNKRIQLIIFLFLESYSHFKFYNKYIKIYWNFRLICWNTECYRWSSSESGWDECFQNKFFSQFSVEM